MNYGVWSDMFVDLLLGALTVFLATSLGSLGIFIFRGRKVGQDDYSNIISFCAGVMAFSAAEMFIESRTHAGDMVVVMGFLVGVIALLAVERSLPHLHFVLRRTKMSDSKKKAALIAGTITIHNIPEGLAVASAFAHSTPLGWLVTSSIAVQDAPEGMMVTAPLTCYGMNVQNSFKYGVFSGVVEGVAALFAYALLSSLVVIIPPALSFSAGAMLYVVLVELLPDAFRGKPWAVAMFFVGGIVVAFCIASFLRF